MEETKKTLGHWRHLQGHCNNGKCTENKCGNELKQSCELGGILCVLTKYVQHCRCLTLSSDAWGRQYYRDVNKLHHCFCFLLQEEQKSGSDLSWWWSLLFAKCRGDIGLCSWGCRKSKESWKARPAHANSWAHLWVYYQALYWFELPPIRQPKPWHQHFLSIWNEIVQPIPWIQRLWITPWEPGSSTDRFIYQSLPQANLLYQCELPPKVLHKIGGKADFVWTTKNVNSLGNSFWEKNFSSWTSDASEATLM